MIFLPTKTAWFYRSSAGGLIGPFQTLHECARAAWFAANAASALKNVCDNLGEDDDQTRKNARPSR
jgi:hypothetical protein